MNASSKPVYLRPEWIGALLLVAASVALTFGFACALPLAAFAAMSAMLFDRRAAVAAVVAIWLVNQIVGFACLNYPMDVSTFAWGAVFGVIALLSLAAAQAVLARGRGVAGSVAGFVSAFVVYEASIYAASLLSGTDVSHFTPADVTRVFLINAAAFAAFFAVKALVGRTELGRKLQAGLALRHA